MDEAGCERERAMAILRTAVFIACFRSGSRSMVLSTARQGIMGVYTEYMNTDIIQPRRQCPRLHQPVR